MLLAFILLWQFMPAFIVMSLEVILTNQLRNPNLHLEIGQPFQMSCCLDRIEAIMKESFDGDL